MAKTFSFAVVHMGVAFGVGYLMTGSVAVGSALALVEPLVNSVAYFFHEKAWSRVERRANPVRKDADFMSRPQAVPAN